MRNKIAFLFLVITLCSLKADVINWNPPSSISTAGIDASNPQICIDNLGNSAAAWIENGVIRFSQQVAGNQWSPPESLSSSGATEPQITIDFSGNITVLWLQNGVVSVISKPLEGKWFPSSTLSDKNASTPKLVADNGGNCVAVWARDGIIESSTKAAAGSWPASPDVLSTGGSSFPSLAIGNDGTVLIAWNQLSQNSYSVLSTYKTNGSNWTTPSTLVDSLATNPFCIIGLNDGGQGVATWCYSSTSQPDKFSIQYAAWNLSKGWTSPITFARDDIPSPGLGQLSVGIGADGATIFFWKTVFMDNSYGFRTLVIDANGSIGIPVDLVAYNIYTFSGDLFVLPPGQAIATFMQYESSSDTLSIKATMSNIASLLNQYWTMPISLSTGEINGYPHLAATSVNDQLSVAAIWMNYNGTNSQVFATTGTASLLPPPSNLVVKQASNNYGLFVEYYNTLTWQASPSPEVKGYVVYRNGKLLGTVSASDSLKLIDHNQSYNEAVTYGVAASDFGESQSITIAANFPVSLLTRIWQNIRR